MDSYFDFVAYAWIIGILMVLVALVGYFVCRDELRALFEHRGEQDTKTHPPLAST